MFLYYNTAISVIHGHNKLANPIYVMEFKLDKEHK
jgi:hypothetical protein